MAQVYTSSEDFKDTVLQAVCRHSGVETAAFVGDMKIKDIGLGEYSIITIVQKVEKKLHICINDSCIDDDLSDLTVNDFAELLRVNIV